MQLGPSPSETLTLQRVVDAVDGGPLASSILPSGANLLPPTDPKAASSYIHTFHLPSFQVSPFHPRFLLPTSTNGGIPHEPGPPHLPIHSFRLLPLVQTDRRLPLLTLSGCIGSLTLSYPSSLHHTTKISLPSDSSYPYLYAYKRRHDGPSAFQHCPT